MTSLRDDQLDAALAHLSTETRTMNTLPVGGQSAARHKPLKAVAITSVAMALLIAGLVGWRASRPAPPAWAGGPIDVVATTLKMDSASVRLEALGELRAARQVTLPAEVPGRVAAIAFESGRRVEAGTVLVQLDDAIEQADLSAAKANAAFARQQLARATELAKTGAMSQEILQQRQAEHEQTKAQVEQLEARIRQKRIRAPFSGELGLRRIDPGQYLNAGESTVTLTDLDKLYVNFDVPQQQLGRVRVGQRVDVNVGQDIGTVRATVNAIEPQVGRDTRNATVQAELPNVDRKLRPGMYAAVAVEMPDESNVLLLPATAIMTSPSGDAVVLVRDLSAEKNGKAEFTPVTVGRRIGDRVIITKGLKPGDVVVTEGQVRIQPGGVLHVVEKPTAAKTASIDGGKA
jgi:multidrug efflux system membrane fusion protein